MGKPDPAQAVADVEAEERTAYRWLRCASSRLLPAADPPYSQPVRRMLAARLKLGRLYERGEREGLAYAGIAAEARALLEAEEGYGYRRAVEEADRAAGRERPPIPSGGWR